MNSESQGKLVLLVLKGILILVSQCNRYHVNAAELSLAMIVFTCTYTHNLSSP